MCWAMTRVRPGGGPWVSWTPDVSKDRQKLVDVVAAEVARQLRSVQEDKTTPPKADVRPPVGICTGDYSKFPELAGRLHGRAAAEAAVVALSGIVTANQLQQAWETARDGVATLAHDARLTPLANDLARQHPEKIQRSGAGSASAPDAGRWLWWSDGGCPVSQSIVQGRADRFSVAASQPTPTGMTQVIRDLARSVKAGQVRGGVLFVRSAARVMCYANRCASLRAVVGTCGEAVEEGINELGANVLVIEYPHVGPSAMEAMVDRMVSRDPAVPAATQRDLADLHRCG